MTENKDLFDVYDLNDIPQELRSELKQDCFAEEIFGLFRLAGGGTELTVDAVTVAHYRKYIKGTSEKPKLKKQIMSKLYALGKDKESPIEAVNGKKGTYRLKSDMDFGTSNVSIADFNTNAEVGSEGLGAGAST